LVFLCLSLALSHSLSHSLSLSLSLSPCTICLSTRLRSVIAMLIRKTEACCARDILCPLQGRRFTKKSGRIEGIGFRSISFYDNARILTNSVLLLHPTDAIVVSFRGNGIISDYHIPRVPATAAGLCSERERDSLNNCTLATVRAARYQGLTAKH
jgi:hypothetical protein